jgi:hypothetical protein
MQILVTGDSIAPNQLFHLRKSALLWLDIATASEELFEYSHPL